MKNRKEERITLNKFISFIEEHNCISVEAIARELNISLKTVYFLTNKAEKVLKRRNKKITILPAQCKKCGFTFSKLGATKCPRCGSMWIEREKICIK